MNLLAPRACWLARSRTSAFVSVKNWPQSTPLQRSQSRAPLTSSLTRHFSATMPPKKEDLEPSTKGKEQPHQHQAGGSTHRKDDEWKHREPYRIHDDGENFDVKWKGKCHCGKTRYELSRDKPLAAKYCHCTTCQRLHGVSTVYSALRLHSSRCRSMFPEFFI